MVCRKTFYNNIEFLLAKIKNTIILSYFYSCVIILNINNKVKRIDIMYRKCSFNKLKCLSIALIVASCIIFASCVSLFDNGKSHNIGELSVHFLDVGQGDSIFIELPDERTMLIDAGDRGCGDKIVQYINNEGYSKVDFLIATHPHADHIGSMDYVVDNLEIGQVYMPKVATSTKTFENLLTAISKKGLKIKSALAGTSVVEEDKLCAQFVAPVELDEDDLNNCSLVLKLEYNKTSFLFTGDAEEKELEQITADISADVLKVGHHGSRTSTYEEFVDVVDPYIAVISCGKNNDYKHPHKEVLKLLKDKEVYRTDEDGTVVISSYGNDINIETEK